MRRLFFQSKLYDYTSKVEAEKHIEEMWKKCWIAKKQDNGEFIFEKRARRILLFCRVFQGKVKGDNPFYFFIKKC